MVCSRSYTLESGKILLLLGNLLSDSPLMQQFSKTPKKLYTLQPGFDNAFKLTNAAEDDFKRITHA